VYTLIDTCINDTFNLKMLAVFRLYVKPLGDKAVYRVEESVKMRSPLVDVLHTIRGSILVIENQTSTMMTQVVHNFTL
jgi:hypothetical protein